MERLLRHLLLLQVATAVLATEVFVGESFTRQCGGNTPVYWWLNGKLTSVTGNQYSVESATVDHNGTLKCTATDQDGSHALVTFDIRIHGLLGVTTSPSNCSSTDNTTNTCSVFASINASLTLCANLTHYPSNAELFPQLMATAWRRHTKEWMWVCARVNESDFSCVNYTMHPSSTISGDWGRCLHLDSVTQNNTFSFEIAVSPYKDYPAQYADKIMKRASFNVQML